MRITSKGQVTIPQEIRERLGLLPHTEVAFDIEGNAVVLRKVNGGDRGQRIVDHLKRHRASRLRMGTDELMSLLRDEPDDLDAARLKRPARRPARRR